MDKDDILLTIREVREGGHYVANWYLDRGYVLLDVQSAAKSAWFPGEPGKPGLPYVRRHPIFVLGRPEGVAPAESPEEYLHRMRQEKQAKEGVTAAEQPPEQT